MSGLWQSGSNTALYFSANFVHENLDLDECIDMIKIRLSRYTLGQAIGVALILKSTL